MGGCTLPLYSLLDVDDFRIVPSGMLGHEACPKELEMVLFRLFCCWRNGSAGSHGEECFSFPEAQVIEVPHDLVAHLYFTSPMTPVLLYTARLLFTVDKPCKIVIDYNTV